MLIGPLKGRCFNPIRKTFKNMFNFSKKVRPCAYFLDFTLFWTVQISAEQDIYGYGPVESNMIREIYIDQHADQQRDPPITDRPTDTPTE